MEEDEETIQHVHEKLHSLKKEMCKTVPRLFDDGILESCEIVLNQMLCQNVSQTEGATVVRRTMEKALILASVLINQRAHSERPQYIEQVINLRNCIIDLCEYFGLVGE